MSHKLSFWLLVGAILLLCVLFYRVMANFLVPLFLAALLVVIFGPVHRWILKKCSGHKRIAAALTTAAVMLSVLVPFGLIGMFAALEGRDLIAQVDLTSLNQKTRQARVSMGLDMEYELELQILDESVSGLLDNFEQDDFPTQRVLLNKIEDANRKLTKAVFDATGGDSAQPVASEQRIYARKGMRVEAAWVKYHDSLNTAITISNSTSDAEELPDASQTPTSDSLDDQPLHDEQTDATDQSVEPGSLQLDRQAYQAALIALAHDYRDFKNELMGGRVRAWAKELANPSDEQMKSYLKSFNDFIQEHIFSIGGATTAFLGKIVIGVVIMVVAIYFFLLDGPAMIAAFKFLSPLDDVHEQELLDEFSRVSRAVVLAMLLSAIAQGLLAGVGFYFAGLDSIFLLMLLSTAMALIPFVGTATVWVPCCLWLYFVDGRMFAAIMLAIYGTLVISMIDNLIKPLVLHGQSNLHPLLALLSVLGGVTALGPIGILVGPMVVVFLQTLLKILQRELSSMDENEVDERTSLTAESEAT